MKKILKFLLLLLFSILFLANISFAAVDDNSVIEKLSDNNTTALKADFKLQKFSSCEDMSTKLTDFMKKYYDNNYFFWRWWPIMYDTAVNVMWAEKMMATDSIAAPTVTSENWWWALDHSTTNTQVAWVDESEIVKTDWKYIYYAVDSYDYTTNKSIKKVFIVKDDNWKMNVIKKVNLPDHFSSVELYIAKNKLVILANWYPVQDFQKQYWDGSDSKTYTMVFDTTDIDNLKLEKLYMTEWAYTKSRMIGDNLYVVWSKNFNYYALYNWVNKEDLVIKPSDVISNELDLTYTTDSKDQNLTLKWKDLPYNVTSGESVDCSQVEYILPDEDTINKYGFNPSFNVISKINIADTSKEVKNQVIFGDIHEVYMSLDSLYLTSYLYTNYDFKCGPMMRCISQWYYRWENTMIHKFDLDNLGELDYKVSAVVAWNPLTQYSMDEYKSNFRIITSSWYPERETNLYLLDNDLNLTSSLTWLAKWENFQSSRFIKDKLFLVTFEQIDPLFAIDLIDVKKPTILWELKIPGYSTYLHPYDDNHLIWLWYDTKTNKYGWTVNAWLKVDLYEVNYDKKCGDTGLSSEEQKWCDAWTYKWIIVKQLYTKTLWVEWSNSEALNNPRMFSWNATKKLLFLPATTYDKFDATTYKYGWFYNWLNVLNIDKDTWIKNLFKTTHIDANSFVEARNKECETYISQTKQVNQCKKLLDGTTYCPNNYVYVPDYCYDWSKIEDFIAASSWKLSNYFIKRWIYIGNNFYAISDGKITSNSLSDYSSVGSVELK